MATRSELLEQWRAIEDDGEEEQDDGVDPSDQPRPHHSKEQWFASAFRYLISLPRENHIWCGSWDLMGPLLETFYNYFKDDHDGSPLRRLWRRISEEMRECVQCITQHHQAQEMYSSEYESSSISALLDVFQCLDEERLTIHLREINVNISKENYDPASGNAEVVSAMYEVLMYPYLLDDQSLFSEFEKFIEAIDNIHELALDGHQQFPGVYALFFFKRRVRSVGYRLAGSMGKLRGASDLEPLQPLLKKFIGFLELEFLPSGIKTKRPRAELDRVSVWLGLKSLLGFLEPPAFEEGILERYPIFLDIVLNHVSGDSMDFAHAITCLRQLFEMLGCKLWLRSTLSPSVMRNTLLGQCFHTRNEKSHKDIFDLFQPLLQSLEALQNEEHEKQRRHFLYFLLNQVPVSNNFSVLTRQKARQLAFFIVHRGYSMNPPSPPYECAHMWGPPLALSLKDSSLHNSLRQPAFDLIETVMVSDASALIRASLNCCPPLNTGRNMSHELSDDEDEFGLLSAVNAEVNDNSVWKDFSVQSKIASAGFREWMCVPMLWTETLLEINPSILPISFSKAVFWARSHFSVVESESDQAMPLLKMWLSSCEISATFGWKVPIGSNDGADEKDRKNSIRVSTMMLPLIQAFNRLTAHFLTQLLIGELWKQWTWEPRMGESLILSLIDPNDTVRQFGKCMLEHVSDTKGLASGLKFLCSSRSSLSSALLGLRHAANLVQLDSVILKFQTLQHYFFVLRKLLEEGELSTFDRLEKLGNHVNTTKLSSDGGFLRQPLYGSLPERDDRRSVQSDCLKWQEEFFQLLSKFSWPSIRRCLMEGKAFIDFGNCQITCVRLLEILPVVVARICPLGRQSDALEMLEDIAFDFSWLHDLVPWGKSKLKVVVEYWKKTVKSWLKWLKTSCDRSVASVIGTIEDLISCDIISMDELVEQVSRLSVSLSKEASDVAKRNLSLRAPSLKKKKSAVHDTDIQTIDTVTIIDQNYRADLILLSDDEEETSPRDHNDADMDPMRKKIHVADSTMHILKNGQADDNCAPLLDSNEHPEKIVLTTLPRSESVDNSQKGKNSQFNTDYPLKSQERANLKNSSVASKKRSEKIVSATNNKLKGENCQLIRDYLSKSQEQFNLKNLSNESNKHAEKIFPTTLPRSAGVENNQREHSSQLSKNYSSNNLKNSSVGAAISKRSTKASEGVVPVNEKILREMVSNAEDDPLETALNATRIPASKLAKLSIPAPKRQLIQLGTPTDHRMGRLQRIEARARRFKPPCLDEWYKPILEIDYFKAVGLTSKSKDDHRSSGKLKPVPVCFQSPEEYISIFRPLVLEEFKAQLQSSYLEMNSWEDMYFGVLSVLSVERVDDFHLIRFSHEDDFTSTSRSFSENDIVLLTKETLENLSQEVHMVGKVERRERDYKKGLNILLIRFYFLNGTSRLNQARRLLLERSKWQASRIMSITPQMREFQALSSIKEIPLVPIILKPSNDSPSSNKCLKINLGKLSQPLQQILKSSYNDSQLQAISTAIGLGNTAQFELALIQGPPGTGKTSTILAIASGLLASPLQREDRAGRKSSFSFPKTSEAGVLSKAWQNADLAKQMLEKEQRNPNFSDSPAKRRILICAQSNAAIDELVSRISSLGLYGSDGKIYRPYLVRVGNAKTIHPNSLPYFIDTLVDHRLADEKMRLNEAKSDGNTNSSLGLRSELEKLVDRIRFYEAKRANLSDGNSSFKKSLEDDTHKGDDMKEMSDMEVQVRLRMLYEQKKQLYKDLSITQAREKKFNEEFKGLKYKLRKTILREAEIVLTTLSGCGGDLYGVCSEAMSSHKFSSPSENTLFDAVVIDEAAQALEPATLIPLQLLKTYGTKCIMVGDPKQLPATVLSNVASKFLFECSMFERLQKAGHPVVMLTEQYRMHPEISSFPSLHFYERKLLNGKMSSKSAPFHETLGLGPYVFNDIADGREVRGKNSGALSLYNEHEADAAVELLKFFKNRYSSEFRAGRIGIITPYKSQLSLLRSKFSSVFGSSILNEMELNTVDGFQGREVDILILSTVRAVEPNSIAPNMSSSNIGFVADVRRMNVALTRARLSLWILGNAGTLQTNRNWAALVNNAGERNLIRVFKAPYRSMFGEPSRNDHSKRHNYHVKRHERNSKEDTKSRKEEKRRDKRGESKSLAAGDELGFSKRNDSLSVSSVSVESRDKETDKKKKSTPSKRKGREEDSKKSIDERESDELSKAQVPKKAKSVPGDQSKIPVSASTDAIAKRKKRREDVEAILSSALIPSKKNEKSAVNPLPSKRHTSSSSSAPSFGIKPSKVRKE